MNARGSLIICLMLIVSSILALPASIRLGVGSDLATATSYLALLCGIWAAFMTVKVEMESNKERAFQKKP
ncbi:hypothetical protein [Methanocella conradii]|uniref:hypothetical protein n=1 Tax=Methanocella conradii TaxID=1175444 RepID=UPI0024B32A39|nr:hypothetical protein [Methanocella conradii]MDI6896494.1 hypothetical protein [Methanocella conradii]